MSLLRAALVSYVAIVTVAMLLLTPAARAEVVTNRFVSPCLNTFVPDDTGANVCITQSGAVTVGSMSVGADAKGEIVGNGVLRVQDAALNATSLTVGTFSGTGAVTVSGSSGVLSITNGDLLLGWYGKTGTLDLLSGGRVVVNNGFVGVGTNLSQGTISLSGHSTLEVSGTDAGMGIGVYAGTPNSINGTVTIADGSLLKVTGNHIDMGVLGGTGELVINTGGSVELHRQTSDPVNSLFYFNVGLGDGALGRLTIDNGKLMMDGYRAGMNIGGGSGVGIVNITGADASITLTGSESLLNIGAATTSSTKVSQVNVSNKAQIGITGRGIGIGENGNFGEVNLSGGAGILLKRDSADDFFVHIGSTKDSNGTLTLDQSTMTIDGKQASISIGGFGGAGAVHLKGQDARLAISGDSAFVQMGFGANAPTETSKGTLTLDQSTMTIDGKQATLQIGGFGGVGAVEVKGQGANLGISGDGALVQMGVGPDTPTEAPSTFNIHDQGTVLISGQGMVLGYGTVTVGEGSSLTLTRQTLAADDPFSMVVGIDKRTNGIVTIQDGGAVSIQGENAELEIGRHAHGTVELGGTARLSILGANAAILVGSGDSQDALRSELNVRGGATVKVDGAGLVIGNEGGRGVVTVENTNSSITMRRNSGGDDDNFVLEVGAELNSAGTLNVKNGGSVLLNGGTDFHPQGPTFAVGTNEGTGTVNLSGADTLLRLSAFTQPGVHAGAPTGEIGQYGVLTIEQGARLVFDGAESLRSAASAPPIEIRHGSLTVRSLGQVNASIDRAVPATGDLAIVADNRDPSRVILERGAVVALSAPGWAPLPGDTASYISASRISQSDNQLATGLGSVTGGIVTFNTELLGNLRGMPETLRIGCGQLATVSCGSDVLAVRAVYQMSPLTGAGSLTSISGIDEAKSLITGARTVSAANMSAAIYNRTATLTAREISHIDLDGLRAYAVSGNGEISIVIRGTVPSNGTDWITDAGFGGFVTGAQQGYLQNLSQFTASVIEANPNSQVRFVGHSLGGGLALLMGAATGYDAFAFNAPGVGSVNLEQLRLQLSGLIPATQTLSFSGDHKNLLNVRSDWDIVSSTHLPFTKQLGYRVTVAPTAMEYTLTHSDDVCAKDPAACRPLVAIASQFASNTPAGMAFSQFLSYHSMDFLLAQLVDPNLQVLAVDDNSTGPDPQASGDGHDWRDAIWLPGVINGLSRSFAGKVVSAVVPYFIDPDIEAGLVFTSRPGSPLFRSVQVPKLGTGDVSFELQIMRDGAWIDAAMLNPFDEFVFEDLGGVSTFRLLASHPVDVEDAFFAVSFMSGGIFDGDVFSVAAVPEPSTVVLIALGLGFLAWRSRRRAPYAAA